MSINFLGYNLFSGSIFECAEEIAIAGIGCERNCRIMSCLNPHSFIVAHDDQDFQSALSNADWLVPDGIGVVLAARWLGLPIKNRVTGPDVFTATMLKLDDLKGSVFFLGASEDTLNKIRTRIQDEYPSVVLVGTYSPPFKAEFSPDENAAMINAVNSASPDVLWVGMTAPKQEKWLATHRAELNVGAACAVGAAFDFFAGNVKRSPRAFRSLGLEWLPRLLQQPRRLWSRTFVSAPMFLIEVLCARILHSRRQEG